MKKNHDHSAPLTALLTLLALSPAAHAQVTAIDFGGDYDGLNVKNTGALTVVTGDFECGANAIDDSATSTVGALGLNGSTEKWYPYDPGATLFIEPSVKPLR